MNCDTLIVRTMFASETSSNEFLDSTQRFRGFPVYNIVIGRIITIFQFEPKTIWFEKVSTENSSETFVHDHVHTYEAIGCDRSVVGILSKLKINL